jgi:DHA1 family multidrug resistance protein-like MFS transporter
MNLIPYTLKHGIGVQEYWLVPGIVEAVLAPVGLFMFAWIAREGIH